MDDYFNNHLLLPYERNCKNQFDNHVLVELVFHMDEFFIVPRVRL